MPLGTLPREPLDPSLRSMFETNNTLKIMEMGAGGYRYSGDRFPHLPMEHISLYELKRRIAFGFRPMVPDRVHFAFFVDKRQADPRKGILLTPDELWWMAREFDHVLLSDRLTHHFTVIGDVDRAQERIGFFELWPDRFFLLPEENCLGIAAEASPRAGSNISVSKNEFLKAAVGLITWDTPRLIDQILRAFPARRTDMDMFLRFGFALMDHEADLLSPEAANMFSIAARTASDPSLRQDALRQAYLATLCGLSVVPSRADGAAVAATMRANLSAVLAACPRDQLEAGLLPQELCRLANAASRAGDPRLARQALDLALTKDPECEDAYWLRSEIRLQERDAAGAQADAGEALARNQQALADLARERGRIDPRSEHEIEWKDHQVAGRRRRRSYELGVRRQAAMLAGDVAQARGAAKEAIALFPDEASGYAQLAEVERQAGVAAAAVAAGQQALGRTTDPAEKARLSFAMNALMASLASSAAKCPSTGTVPRRRSQGGSTPSEDGTEP